VQTTIRLNLAIECTKYNKRIYNATKKYLTIDKNNIKLSKALL